MLTNRIMKIGLGRSAGAMHMNLIRSIPGMRMVDDRDHAVYDDHVIQCRERGIPVPPSFVFVRNPWQWYVSQWCWIRHVQREDFPFQGTFREAMELTKKDPSFWYLRSLTWSWRYHQAYKADYVGHMERLEEDTVRIFLAIIPDLVTEQQIRDNVRSDWAGRVCCPNGEYEDRFLDYRKYYDDELRGWVAKWDAELIEEFQYEFESDVSKERFFSREKAPEKRVK